MRINRNLGLDTMRKDEILEWKMRYEEEQKPSDKRTEWELRKKFQNQKFLTKEDLVRVVKWRFQGRLARRQEKLLELIEPVEDSHIESRSRATFRARDDETRLKFLFQIEGVRNILASAVLAFYDPDNYGVLDMGVWRALFGKEPRDIFVNPKRAIEFFEKLREISSKMSLPCRDVEKAIFKREADRSRSHHPLRYFFLGRF